jgi:hypothetical protein
VIFSRHPRRSAPFRHVTKIPSPQLLCLPHLQNRDAHNSFRIRSYENCRVSLGPLNFPTSKPSNLPTLFIYPFSSHVLAHSFARFCTRQNLNSFVFMCFRTLCEKHPGGGYPLTPKSTFSKGFAPLPRTFSAKGRFVHSFTCPEDVHPTYYWSLRAPRAKLFPGQGISLRVYRFRLHGGCYG